MHAATLFKCKAPVFSFTVTLHFLHQQIRKKLSLGSEIFWCHKKGFVLKKARNRGGENRSALRVEKKELFSLLGSGLAELQGQVESEPFGDGSDLNRWGRGECSLVREQCEQRQAELQEELIGDRAGGV